jgi:predicted RNA methylase
MTSTQRKGLTRNTLDKYYTKAQVVEQCLSLVQETISIKDNDIVIEPSAGNGAFISGIKALTSRYRFYDLEPEHNEVVKRDYLLYDFQVDNPGTTGRIHLICNPPFGRQSSLALKFIKKSCEFCDTISFILPKSFKKDSLKAKVPLHFHLLYEGDLPDKSFLVNQEEHNVPCIFQIWEKKDNPRAVPELLKPKGFKFVKQDESPDISFRRVGVNAGVIDINTSGKSIQSHYFIKFKSSEVEKILQRLSTISYDFNNTVGARSISKQELIAKFNPLL